MARIFTGPRRILAVAALAIAAGLASAALTAGIKPGANQVSAAATYIFIDTPKPAIVNRDRFSTSSQIRHAELLSQTLVTPPLLQRVARHAGVPLSQIGSDVRNTASVPLDLTQPGSEQRANDISRSGKPYAVESQARQNSPIVDIYTRAPTTPEAIKLANAAVVALQEELRVTADREGIPVEQRLRLRPLGTARGGVVSAGMMTVVAFFAFLIGTLITAAVLMYVTRSRDRARAARPDLPAEDPWPHTTRLLPWMFAGFLAVLWLVPFNYIQLTVKLPIDLKFDRLVLPFVVAVWIAGMAIGGKLAPRRQLTPIHAAVGAFVVCAFLSVLLDARYLNRTLELETAVKQLPLLVAYVSLFLIASTGIRSNEVWPFLRYTLILAVVCALGVIYEYRTKQNLFYTWSDKLLPPIFSVTKIDASAVDTIGRPTIRGPAALPLETVAMLAMALPIALVSALHAHTWRKRLLFALAACLLLAAAFSTYRKSALLAPLSVILTVAYFRRREILKLSPLALVLIVIIHVAAPGALGKTTTQFDPNQLGVTTVSDRTADYDAIRPDVWTHLLFGRGWGSYEWLTYRILDSELLHRLIEMGVVGLSAFVAMILSVVLTSRRMIAARDRLWSPMALMGAASAISFLTVSMLFDVLAFPHATYIFLCSAGLTAVVIKQRGDVAASPRRVPDRRPAERDDSLPAVASAIPLRWDTPPWPEAPALTPVPSTGREPANGRALTLATWSGPVGGDAPVSNGRARQR